MYGDNFLVGKGLKLLFISQLLSVSSNFMAEGLLSGLVSLASTIVALVGLNTAAPAHPKFRAAFRLNIALCILGVIVAVLSVFQKAGVSLGQTTLLLAVAILVVALGVWSVYLICTAAGEILTVNGYATLADKGVTVWKIFLVTSAAMIVFMLLAMVPFMLVIAGILVIGTAVATLVGGILYMIFLYNAYHALLYGQ